MEGTPPHLLFSAGFHRRTLASAFAVIAIAVLIRPVFADEKTYSTYQPIVSLHDSGPPANRLDVVIATDGYTEASDAKAQAFAEEIKNYFITPKNEKTVHPGCAPEPGSCRVDTEPYVRYRNLLNFHRIKAFSNEDFKREDAVLQPEVEDDVILNERDTIYDLTQIDAVEATAQDSAIDIALDRDAGFWIAENVLRVGLPGWPGTNAAFNLPGEVAAHEGGHGNHDLGDQYFTPGATYTGGANYVQAAWNVSADPTCAKWKHWLGYHDVRISENTGKPLGQIGCYQGASYFQFGLYRPILDPYSSRMAAAGPFNRVAAEKVIYDIYKSVEPLDSYRGNNVELRDPATVWVSEVDPNVIKVDWKVTKVAGQLVRDLSMAGGVLEIASLGLAPGKYQIAAHAYDEAIRYAYSDREPRSVDGEVIPGRMPDPLDIARKREVTDRMQQRVSWQVDLTGGPLSDVIGDGQSHDCAAAAIESRNAAGIRVPGNQRFAVDRKREAGTIVGWVRVDAPNAHMITLGDGYRWLGIDGATGRLEVRDATALRGQPPGLVSVPVCVTAMLGDREVAAGGIVHVDINDSALSLLDEFDDGNPGSNELLNGRGFGTQPAGHPAVKERDGALRLALDGPDSTYKEVAVLSKDSFDFATKDGIEVMWKIAGVEAPAGTASCYLSLTSAKSVPSPQPGPGSAKIASATTLATTRGVVVRLCGERGGLGAIVPWGLEQHELAGWQWSDVGWDGMSPLEVILSASVSGVRVRAGGIEVANVPWPAEFSQEIVRTQLLGVEPFADRTVRAGVLMRGMGPASISLDAVSVQIASAAHGQINQPPKLVPGGIPEQTALLDQSLSLDLNEYVSDPDGDSLTFQATGLPPGLNARADGVIEGTPREIGTYQVSMAASDSKAAVSATFAIQVTAPLNQPPKLIPGGIPDRTVLADQPLSLNLNDYVVDPDGDVPEFRVTGLPPGLHALADGTIEGTPTRVGRYQVSISASDRTATVWGSFVIEVQVPSVGGARSSERKGGSPRLIRRLPDVTVPVNAQMSINLAEYFEGPNGSRLTFGVAGLPRGLSATPNGLIQGMPADVGTAYVYVSVTDSRTRTPARMFTVTIVESSDTEPKPAGSRSVSSGNQAPRLLQRLPDISAPYGPFPAINLDEHFRDPDGEPLQYSVSGAPSGIGVQEGNRLGGILPPGGAWTITVRATDPHGATAEAPLSVQVVSQRSNTRR